MSKHGRHRYFKEGARTYEPGHEWSWVCNSLCPYSKDSPAQNAWLLGWQAAEKEHTSEQKWKPTLEERVETLEGRMEAIRDFVDRWYDTRSI